MGSEALQESQMANLPAVIQASSCHDAPDTTSASKPKKSNRKAKGKQEVWSGSNSAACVPSDDQTTEPTLSVISALQEFLQDSTTFRIPNQHSVLQWRFEERSTNSHSMQYQATVAFLLEGVPHHSAGEWHASKNAAKRDVAERALGLFVSQWGSQLAQEKPAAQSGISPDSRNLLQNLRNMDHVNQAQVDTLMNFCLHFPPCQILPELSTSWEGDVCKGFVQIYLFGVPHTFAGNASPDEDTARVDVARRVLWYLQCPGYGSNFEVDMEALEKGSPVIASPSFAWKADGA